jgi:hypothetical protein
LLFIGDRADPNKKVQLVGLDARASDGGANWMLRRNDGIAADVAEGLMVDMLRACLSLSEAERAYVPVDEDAWDALLLDTLDRLER